MPSSIQLYNSTINDFKKIQGNLNDMQGKIAAESKADTFGELEGDITVVESFKASVSRADRFINTINESNRKLDVAYRSVDRILELAVEFKESLILENSINANSTDINGIGNSILDSITGLLNTRDGANFVFGGSKNNEEPVSNLKLSNNIVNGQPTAGYYNGDEFTFSVDASTSLRVEYGVTASDPAFKDLIGAINLSKTAERAGGAGLEEAGILLDKAIEELITLRADMGNNARIMEDSVEFHQRSKLVFEERLADKVTPNVIELSIQISQAETVLEAVFSNFPRLSDLNLTKYL